MADIIHEGITLEAFMALGSDARVEVIDGVVVEMNPVGIVHHLVARNLYRVLDAYLLTNPIGELFFDGLIYLLHTKGKHLKGAQVPDLSFVKLENLPVNWNMSRPFPGAPDLAVEVMSSDDKAQEVLVRIRRYLRAGTQQVWVAYPDERELHQYQRADSAEVVLIYKNDETIDADSLFPGLRLTVTDIFTLPDWVTKSQNS